jgi:hypothetical protein
VTRKETSDRGYSFLTFYSQETWAVAKTKENTIVVEKPQLCKKPADVKKAANLQNLAARYYSMTPKDYIGQITNVLREEF